MKEAYQRCMWQGESNNLFCTTEMKITSAKACVVKLTLLIPWVRLPVPSWNTFRPMVQFPVLAACVRAWEPGHVALGQLGHGYGTRGDTIFAISVD